MSSPGSTARKPSEVFTEIYTNGTWGPPWVSGSGSNPNGAGQPYCFLMPPVLKLLKAKSVVDLGCGDGRLLAWIASELPHVDFTGVDCVQHHIDLLQKTLPHHNWQLNELETEADLERLPKADVYLIKDVLHHWPTEKIVWLLTWCNNNFLTVIATHDRSQTKADCELGGFRGLDACQRPLSLFRPQLLSRYLHKAVYLFEF